MTSSIHLLTAYLRRTEAEPAAALEAAATEVGAGCLWSAVTTAGGFASFVWSGFTSFRHFGAVAAIGLALAFLMTFSLLPALLQLRERLATRSVVRRRPALVQELISAKHRDPLSGIPYHKYIPARLEKVAPG